MGLMDLLQETKANQAELNRDDLNRQASVQIDEELVQLRWRMQGFLSGVRSEINYEEALVIVKYCYNLGCSDALDLINEIKELMELDADPGKYAYLDDEDLEKAIYQKRIEKKSFIALFYARQLIKRRNPLGYYYYADIYLFHELVKADGDATRILYAKLAECGMEGEAAQGIGDSFWEDDDIEQAKNWLEHAIELGNEEAEEDYKELERLYASTPIWTRVVPRRKVLIPEGYLDGLYQNTRTRDEVRELPDNIENYFEGFIGMTKVKEQIEKIYHTVKLQAMRDKVLEARGEEPISRDRGYNFVLLGNPGTGKTSVARIISKILYDINIRERELLLEVDRSQIVSEHVGETAKQMKNILAEVEGGTLFIDEAYTLYKEESDVDFGQEAIHTLMKDMEDNRNSYSVIMAGYREPMLNMIKKANSGFSSRFTYQIEIPDYTDEELIKMAHMHIEHMKYQVDEKVDDAIRKNIMHDRIDETFGNARYIRELVHKAIENQATRLHNHNEMTDDDLFILKAEDFWQGGAEEKTVDEYLAELDAMTGLASVKEEVKALVNRITVMKEMEKRGLGISDDFGTLHMVFKGNPGTGKTTVARLIGKIYSALGVLKRSDVFVECSRGTLVGKYQGHTADNVNKVVNSALGGILFVDEAYALKQSENDNFGQEAVDTLVSEMENNRNKLVVIFAGYSKEMDQFLHTNQGLKSRIPNEIVFPDYNLQELFEIATEMIKKKKLQLDSGAVEMLKLTLLKGISGLDFGNARGVRNVVEKIIRNQNIRIAALLRENSAMVTDEVLITITKEDISV